MNLIDFTSQINRLKETYGPKHYPDERVKILWAEVRSMELGWFQQVVSEAIAHLEKAPMLKFFCEKHSEFLESAWRVEKRKQEGDAKKFMSKFSGEDIQTICKSITDRLRGRLDDQGFAAMKKMVSDYEPLCRCEESGFFLVEDGGAGTAWKCRCSFGQKRIQNYPVYRN